MIVVSLYLLSELLTYQLYKLDLDTDQRTETNQDIATKEGEALAVKCIGGFSGIGIFSFRLFPGGVVGGDGHFDLGELSEVRRCNTRNHITLLVRRWMGLADGNRITRLTTTSSPIGTRFRAERWLSTHFFADELGPERVPSAIVATR